MSVAEDGEEIEAPPAPLKIQHAVLDTQYNLPIKAEKFSIGLSACPVEGSFVDVDLACALFSTEGSLLDVAYHTCPSALGGSVRHCGSSPVGASNADEDSEIVHVFPALVPTTCCLMVFTAGGFNIQESSALSMTVHAKERKKTKEPVVRCDLLPILAGCNARVALTVYRSGNGWLAYYPSTGTPPNPSVTYWGSLVPHMKMIAATIPSLECAAAFKPDESELYEPQEKQLDESIGSAATRNALVPACRRPEATSWPALPQETCEQKPTPSRLRIDVGWNLWQEEGEGTDLQYQLVFTTATGETVECGEDQGVVQGIQGPAEEEDEEAEPEEGEEAPPEKEEHPAPKGQDIDPHGFPVKDSFYINMASLPAKVKSIVVQVNNFAGSGMRDVKSLCTRVVDATEEDPNAHRDLFVLRIPSGKGEHSNRTVATLAKVYKEYVDSPFAMLREGAAKPLAEFIDDADNVRATLTAVRDVYCSELEAENQLNAALEAEENGEEDVVQPTLKAFDWRVSAIKVLDVAEDAATYADVESKRTAAFEGEFNALGQRHGALVRAVYENSDCYIGTYIDDLRSGKGMYIHANKAAFAGNFQAGHRAGKGIMLLPDGGVYTGEFVADKWEGDGKYEYPDGSCYVGEWKEGKKHGAGTYWDKHGGCLVGTWAAGIMTGAANYRHPAYSMQGTFTKGIPDGQFTFEAIAFRKLADPTLPEAAAAHIRSPQGPSLTHTGTYAIPEGAAKDPEVDEDGNEVEPDADAPKMPAFPNYSGLVYTAGSGNPEPGNNTVYPPVDVDVPVCVTPASFDVAQGLQVAAK